MKCRKHQKKIEACCQTTSYIVVHLLVAFSLIWIFAYKLSTFACPKSTSLYLYGVGIQTGFVCNADVACIDVKALDICNPKRVQFLCSSKNRPHKKPCSWVENLLELLLCWIGYMFDVSILLFQSNNFLKQWSGCGCVLLCLSYDPGICLTSCRSTQPMRRTKSSHCRFGFKDSHQLAPIAGSRRPEDTACMFLFREGSNIGSTSV